MENTSRYRMIMPLQQNRFRLLNCNEDIVQNTNSLKFNFAKKTVTLEFRETVANTFDAAVLLATKRTLSIAAIDGTGDQLHTLTAQGLKLIDHEMVFDYSSSKPVTHTFIWEYRDVGTLVEHDHDHGVPIVAAEGCVTPAEAVVVMDTKLKVPTE